MQKTSINTYTNTMFDTFCSCPAKYYYKYVQGLIIPQKQENFELGKSLHALLSHRLNGFDISEKEKFINEPLKTHYKAVINSDIFRLKPILTEWAFNVNVKDTHNILAGRIDAVFFDEQKGKYTIADWKTASSPVKNPEENFQAQIYLYAFYKARKDLGLEMKPESIDFKFIQTPDINISQINFSQKKYEEYENKFSNTISEIEKYTFSITGGQTDSCKNCEYRFVCLK
ncbi:MAG: PD-(D/E)XK nuclease family protein [Candidatus Gastranaerophilales bacterium]|nr:PD-(D/E)XK nuclease family protein [Candidatus Gastranaerophilales bacterium]